MTLTLGRKLAYGVGHVFNDLCASMWFTYTLIFFNKVILFSSSLAGIVVLTGQIADGLATPFVGYFSDRGDDFWICKYGRRKTWHLIGTLCVVASFPFIFTPCLGCEDSDSWAQMIYYSAFVIIFQFGWASAQISHLSLVPELTPDEHERTSLLAIRYSFTVISNIVVYLLLWIVLQVDSNNPDAPITPKDTGKFQVVAYTVVALGCVTSFVFHTGVKETQRETLLPHDELGIPGSRQESVSISPWGLFGKIRLYQVAVLYMATRLFANISQTIFPLYLHDVLHLGGQNIAILPLVMYAFSFLMSTLIKPLNKKCGRKVAFCFGAAVGVGVSIWVRVGEGEFYTSYLIYAVAGLYGITSSALLVTSLGITADLIGHDLNNGAFIYGLMSFCDKLSNGALVMVIQTWTCWPTCATHYRESLSYVCGGAALLGAVAVMSLCNTPTTEELEEDQNKRSERQEETRENVISVNA
ncbi:major facilitator superfamily domain-containing protein 12-like isoform X2 [Macrosteles quadrilineatus]|nr:major facilitator superfamily domain-containing protein 12-like isoform X2 [Macrosteles quadrilineatus]XP_054278763.1 major facilitator superfamily domain-containing protein 12-like isoform X2 [Macrosteles quadrilineatus]